MFRGNVKGTGYPLHSPVSPSLPLPCVIVSHHISTGPHVPVFRYGVISGDFVRGGNPSYVVGNKVI